MGAARYVQAAAGGVRSLVQKAGVLVGGRTYLNFIEGANITLTIADDSVNDQIDITIASSGGSGAPTDADYLVGTANAGLSAEIPVGTTPGGDLAGVSSSWAAPVLKQASSAFGITGVITPAALVAQADDYNPAGLSGATVLRISATGAQTITGLAGGATGRIIILDNVGAADIFLSTASLASTATNRFLAPQSVGRTLRQYDRALLRYDGTLNRWIVMISTGVAEAGANVTIDGAGATGTDGNYPSPADHGHRVNTYSSAAAAIGTAAAGTAADAPSRGSHVHPTGAGVPTTQVHGDAAATGAGPEAAMTNHKHAFANLSGDVTTSGSMATALAVISGGYRLTGVESLATTGTVNDFAIAAGTNLLRTTGGSATTLQGMVAPSDGRVVLIENQQSAGNLTIAINAAGSSANNRFRGNNSRDIVVQSGGMVAVVYDSTATSPGWRIIGLFPAKIATTNIVVGVTATQGTAGDAPSPADHGHQLVNSTATPAAATSAGTAGTSTNSPLPSDHSHPFGTATKSIYILAGDFYDGTTPAVPTKLGTAPDATLSSAAMSASATSNLLFTFTVPSDWVSGAMTYIIFFSCTAGSVSGTIRWQMDVKEIVVGTSVYDVAGTSTAFTGAAAARTAKVIYSEAAQTLATPSATGVLMRCALQRLGADGADTITDTCQVHQIHIKYTGTE